MNPGPSFSSISNTSQTLFTKEFSPISIVLDSELTSSATIPTVFLVNLTICEFIEVELLGSVTHPIPSVFSSNTGVPFSSALYIHVSPFSVSAFK